MLMLENLVRGGIVPHVNRQDNETQHAQQRAFDKLPQRGYHGVHEADRPRLRGRENHKQMLKV